ncbi:MAG: T9SS type A sorting domain-containing protein, partial [Sphingobacteriales bacterium]
VYNVLGAKLTSFDIKKGQNGTYRINLTNLANGVYVLNVTANGVAVSKRIVINK